MAGRIPRQFIDDMLARVDIVELIDQYVPLKKAGVNHKACCPFHNEKTPSFTVSSTKQFYHCFGCGANGSAIGFLMDFDHMHFVDAVEYLAQRAGMQVPTDVFEPVTDQQQSLFQALTQCSAYYCDELRASSGAIDYLKQRGISGETAREFQLGYAPQGWHNLEEKLSLTSSALLGAGMLVKSDNGKCHDRFRERIMYPIRDRRGRTIGFGGRIIGSGEPKYLNSPETALFQKGRELYGLYELRRARGKEKQPVLVVEGYMDVIALAEHNIRNAVATLGTATSTEQIIVLFRESDDVVFCFDGDRAGRQAAWRALKSTLPCLKSGRSARFLFLPDGDDPDTLINRSGRDAFLALLKSAAIEANDFLLQELRREAAYDNDTASSKAKLAQIGKPLIERIPAGIYRNLIEQQLTDLVGTLVFDAAQAAAPAPATSAQTSRPQPQQPSSVKSPAVRRAVAAILEKPAIVLELDPELYEFSTQITGAQMLLDIIALIECDPQIDVSRILEHYRDRPEWTALNRMASASLAQASTPEFDAPVDILRQCIVQLNKESDRADVRQLPLNKPPSEMSDEEKAEIRKSFLKLQNQSG